MYYYICAKKSMKVKRLIDNKIFACAMAVVCTMMWGTAFPFIKLGYSLLKIDSGNVGSSILFAGLRFTIAGMMVFIFLLITDRHSLAIQKSDIAPLGTLGLVQIAGQYIFTYIGIGFTSSTNTSIITACASFFTVLAAGFFFKKTDRLTAFKVLGCVIGFSGVVVINQGGSENGNLFGDIMILLSTVCAASGNIISKKIVNGRNPIKVNAFQLIVGGIVLTVAGLCCGGKLAFNGVLSVSVLLWLAFISAAAFTIWTTLLKHHPASMITVFNLLVPVFGTVLSGVMLGENIFKPQTAIALVLIVAGIATVNLSDISKNRLIAEVKGE